MISFGDRRTQQWRSEGLSGFLITPEDLLARNAQRENLK
jgi:hypothetical protein